MSQPCPMTDACPFFEKEVPGNSRAVDILRRRYCMPGGAGCARKLVRDTLGKELVPDDMFPNDDLWAQAILEAQFRKRA